jgi:hypothetical protein
MQTDAACAADFAIGGRPVLETPGLTLIIGEPSERADVLRRVESCVDEQGGTVVRTESPADAHELYGTLIAGFGAVCTSTLKSRQLMALEAALRRLQGEGRRSVLIVDKADALSADMLEEIRLCLNMQTANDTLLDIVMAGSPRLLVMLRRHEFRQLKQRAVACHILGRRPQSVPPSNVEPPADHGPAPRGTLSRETSALLLSLISITTILVGGGLLWRQAAGSRKAEV